MDGCGSLSGDTLDAARIYRLEPLGGIGASGDPFDTYGKKAAHVIMTRVKQVPLPHRKQAMHVILDALDPRLWAGVENRASRMPGVPAAAALELALAEEMGTGLLDEVVALGKKQKAPKASSQLGAAIYGPGPAMGEVLEALGAPAPAATCYEWIPAVGTTPGRWALRTSTASRPCPAPTATTSTPRITPYEACAKEGGVPSPGYGVTWKPGTQGPEMVGCMLEWIEVGPFRMPSDGPASFSDSRGVMTENWKNQFKGAIELLAEKSKQLLQMQSTYGAFGTGMFAANKLKPAKDYGLDKWLGYKPDERIFAALVDGHTPAFKVKHPKTGDDWGVYLILTPTRFGWAWKKIPESRSWWGALWDFIKSLPGLLVKAVKAIVEAAGDILGAVADMACDLLQKQPQAAALVATAAGGPAGAAGVSAAAGACGGPKQEAPPPYVPPEASDKLPAWLLPVAIGGGALVLVLALTGKKKKGAKP